MRALVARSLCLVLMAVLSAGASGCYSKATGYNGRFTFAYAAGAEFENFGKPIAPGAKLDVVAFANGTEDKLVLTGATSSRPGVLAVKSVGERGLVLEAGEPGVADIEISARDAAGNALVDRMFLHVARPAVHRLQHACTPASEAIYVLGDRVDVSHGLATSDGRPVIGYAYAPLRVAPADALELVAQPQGAAFYGFRPRATNPKITIHSTVDDSALSLRVIARGELKDATLDCGDDCRLLEGERRYVVAHTHLGDTPVCSQTALTRARSLTPAICSVSARLEDDDGTDSNREQLAVVTGLGFGLCKYEVTLPELDGGRGVRLTGEAKIGRVEFPGEKRSGPASLRLHGRGRALGYLVALGWLLPRLAVLALVTWRWRRRGAALNDEAAAKQS